MLSNSILIPAEPNQIRNFTEHISLLNATLEITKMACYPFAYMHGSLLCYLLQPQECRSLTDHKSGIRDLCLMESTATGGEGPVAASAFCSASNDGTVRAWGAAGDCRAIFTIPGGVALGLGGWGDPKVRSNFTGHIY